MLAEDRWKDLIIVVVVITDDNNDKGEASKSKANNFYLTGFFRIIFRSPIVDLLADY